MADKKPQDIQERTFEFAKRVVKLHQYLYELGGTERVLAGQILRSGTSIGANLEEANAGQSKPDFINKCNIALKEARETLYWLRLLIECHLVSSERLSPLISEADEIVAILTTIVKNARTNLKKERTNKT
ncbi:MAG: four helix bundle protein [Anaerolineae bacterium]|nr:four helix bundle protein [Anaerolineae bacterium]